MKIYLKTSIVVQYFETINSLSLKVNFIMKRLKIFLFVLTKRKINRECISNESIQHLYKKFIEYSFNKT